MADQRTSLYVIVILGVAGFGVVMVMMMMSLEGLQQTPAGTRLKIANAVATRFPGQEATVDFRESGGATAIHLQYVTRKYAKPDEREREMRDVAQFVHQESLRYEDPELLKLEQIAVRRVQLHGSGCFQSRYESSFAMKVPKREPPNPEPPH